MADYYVDIDGNVTKKKKKPSYVVDIDGNITKVADDATTVTASKASQTEVDHLQAEYDRIKVEWDKAHEEMMQDPVPGSEAGARWSALDDQLSEAYNALETAKKQQYKENNAGNTWLQGGYQFSDGYQFGDVTKTVAGSVGDVAGDIVGGLAEVPEKILDALIAVAPYAAAGQYYSNGGGYNLQADAAFKQQHESAKQIASEIVAKDLYKGQVLGDVVAEAVGGPDAELNSVFGDKSDALAQSAGQLTGTALLQMAGVPAWLTTGLTSFGGEMENALNQGATYEEAGLSSLITAGAEVLTEQISGGINFSKLGTLDDAATQALARGISNKVLRTAAKLGMDVVGEGAEEVASGLISAVGQKLTYMSEAEWKDLFSSEDAWESFIGGAVLGGIGGTVQFGQSTAQGKDYTSGLTKNEHAVVDKVYKDALAEAEKTGKVSAKEKTEIYNEVLENMDKGYISTDTVEEVLGGETYKTYKDTVDSEDALQKEYDELKQVKDSEATLEQKERFKELKAQLEDIKKNSSRNQLKTQLSQEVSDMVKSDRLSESYNERGRRSQKFEADLAQYTPAQRKIVQKAIDSGILNNTNRSHEFVDLVAKVAADKNLDFDFADNAKLKETGFALDGVTVNGFVNENGVTINLNSAKALNSVVGHEVAHVLEGTELYDALKQTVTEYAKSKGEYDTRLKQLTKLYKGRNANIEQELVADLIGDYLFTDKEFVSNLSTEHRDIFDKIFDEVKYLYKTATAGSKEARQLLKVKKAFEEAYRAETKNPTTEGGVKYDIVALDNGNVYVKASRNVITGQTKADQRKNITDFFNDLLDGSPSLDIQTIEGDVLTITKADTAGKARDDHKTINGKPVKMTDNEFLVKLRVESHIDEVAETAQKRPGKVPDGKNHAFAPDGFTYRRAYFEDFDGQYYEVTLSIGHNGTVATVYNVGKINKGVLPSAKVIAVVGSKALGKTPSTNSLSEKSGNVNNKNFLSEQNQFPDDFAPLPWDIKGEDVAYINSTDDLAPIGPNAERTYVPDQNDLAPLPEGYEEQEGATSENAALGKNGTEPAQEDGKVAKILFGEQQTPKQKSAWKWAKEHIFSHGAVFEDLSLKTGNRELQAKFDNIRRAESRAQNFIGNGKGNAKALVELRKEVEKTGKTEDFNYYLYHLHNVDRMTLEQRFEGASNKSVFGDSVDAETSQKAAINLETLNPEFKQWAEDVYAINKHLRQMMVDEGIISQDTAKLWEEMYPHYVPISRADAKGLSINVPLDTKRTGVNAPIKKATGGNSDFYNVFDTMGSRVEQTYKAIAKNRFGVELMDTLGTAFESEVADVDTVLENMDTHEDLLQEGKNGESPTFTVFQNGEKVKFAITEDMYDAMKPSQFTYTSKAMRKINDVRRDILTTYSPTFALTNPIKDIQDVLLNSQHPAKTYATIPEAIKAVITKDQWYQERMENGGNQDTYFDGRTKTFKEEDGWFKKVMGFVPSKIQAANEIIEQVPRMAEYIASRKMGRSIDVSMLDAARVTTNFGAAGDLTNMLNRNGFTFLGASVEGFNQQVRNIREAKAEGVKGWAKLAGKYLAAGLPALLLNHMLWDDDEEYEDLSDYVKQNYYVVAKTDDGKFIRIPKGRTVAVIQDAFKQMENLITGNDEVDMESFGQLVLNNLAPNNPMENNIVAPLVQAHTNQTWYGDELVPTRLQDVPAAEQFDETTDSISRWLGEATDTSPYKWNYLLDQYTGGVGDLVLPYLTPEADGGGIGAAFRDKFTVDPVLKNQNVSDFYDKMDELTVNANSMYATDEDILKSKYMSTVNSDLSKLHQQKREIQNSDLSDAEKYAAVRQIQEQINMGTADALESYDTVTIDGCYATVGHLHFRKNSDGSWQKVNDEQLARQEAVTAGLGIQPGEYWSRKEEYDYAYDYPGKYALSQAVGGYDSYKTYNAELNKIEADKDEDGKGINGSRQEKVLDYINSLDLTYGERLVLYKSVYNGDDTYNYDIIAYLNSRKDLTYKEKGEILKELGFEVDASGNVTWD